MNVLAGVLALGFLVSSAMADGQGAVGTDKSASSSKVQAHKGHKRAPVEEARIDTRKVVTTTVETVTVPAAPEKVTIIVPPEPDPTVTTHITIEPGPGGRVEQVSTVEEEDAAPVMDDAFIGMQRVRGTSDPIHADPGMMDDFLYVNGFRAVSH